MVDPQPSTHLRKEDFQQQFYQKFRQKSKDHDSFHQMMQQSFSDGEQTDSNKGSTYNYEGAEALRKRALQGDLSWLPEVKILSRSEFSDAQLFHQGQASGSESFLGAFGDETIFLNESILSDPELALRVYSEEAGHAIDKILNQERDTLGDEGAIFSKLLMNKSLSAKQIHAFKNENDQGYLAGIEVEFLSDSGADSVILKINDDRIAEAKKTNAANVAAAAPGEEVEKVEPKLLTAKEEKGARDIYTQVKAEGKTDKEATSLTTHLMKPKNEGVRNQLGSKDAMAELASGKTLAEVVTGIETKTDLNGISQGFDSAIKTLTGSDIAIPNKEAILMILEGGKTTVDVLAINVGGKDLNATGLAESIKLITKQTGKTFSQIVEDMGKGDLSGFGAVMTDIGTTYHTAITENENLKTWAASTHLAGSQTIAMGQAMGNPEMVAAGEIMLGGAAFMGTWDFEVEGKPGASGATPITRTGDGVAFLGTGFSAIGKLIGDKGMTNVGGYLTTASGLSGPINTLHKLYTTEINFKDVGIVRGKVQENINADTAVDAGVGFLSAGLDLGAMIIGDENEELATRLGQTSDMVTNSYSLFEAITDGGTAADISTAGIAVVMEILEIAGVEIDPKVKVLIDKGLSALSAANAAEEGGGAAVEFLAPYIVDIAASMGIQLTEKAVKEAVGTAASYAAVVYELVMFGFDLAEIAQNDNLSTEQKLIEAHYALSDTTLAIGLTLSAVPIVGWVILAVAAVMNVATANVDIIENGFTRRNVGRLFGGQLSDLLFPPRDPNAWISTMSPADQAPAFDEEGFYMETGNKGVSLSVESPFGVTRLSMHELEIKEDARLDMIDDYKPLFKQVKTTDENLANALNIADEENGEVGLSMELFRSSLENDNDIKKKDGDLADGMDGAEMLDYRYGEIGNRISDPNTGSSKAGIALNAWLDGIDMKVIDESGDTFSSADIIAKTPALLTMSPEIIERLLNTVEPGNLEHVLTQLTNTVGTYLNTLTNPLIQDPPMNEHQTLDFVIDKLGLTEDYRFSIGGKTDVPQRVKDFVTHLNEVEGHGTIKLLGQGIQMGEDPENNYQLVVDGELDSYRFVDGDTPYFMKMSRAIIDLSGEYGNWPPSNTVDWKPLETDKNANPLYNGAELPRQGDFQWVKPDETLTENEQKRLTKAEVLTAELQAKGKDVKLLGISKLDGHVELLVEGKQHAYKLEDNGDRFVQVSQRKLHTDIPGNVQKFHADLNRIREKEDKEGVQLVSLSEDGKTYQLIVDGEQNAYRYVENIEYDYSNGSRIATEIDNSYYEKVSRTEANADWPPHHAVNWSDKNFQDSREGNLIQWIKPENTLSDKEEEGLAMAQALVDQQQLNGQDVKLLGVSSKTKDDTFELLVEGKQHAYKMVNDGENFKFVQLTQTRLYAKTEPGLAASTAPETTLPLADGNAAFMAGNYQGVIDYVNQNPSSGTDQQILDTYKQAAEHGLELEQAIAKGDYGEMAAKLKSIADGLKLVAPDLSDYYGTGVTLATQADIIIDSILSGNYTLAKSMAEGFLKTLGEHPEFTEKLQSIVDLARYVIDVSNLYSEDGNLTAAAEQADEYANGLPEGELKTAFGAIANNIRNEESAGILILAGNTALTAGNYQGIINHITAMTGPNTATDQAVVDAYEDAANIGLKMERTLTAANQTLSTEGYAKAATYFGFLADKLQPFAPEVANDYRVGETLSQTASTITQAVQSGDYPGAIAAAQSYQAILAENPGIGEKFPSLSSLFGPATNLANHIVLIAEHYNAGNLTEATQLAETYANTLPSGGLKDAFSDIIPKIFKTEDAKAA
jgi:sulfopyruvate decarboxylase TPP-binding subunit